MINEIIKLGKITKHSNHDEGFNEDYEFTIKYKKKEYDFSIDFHYTEGDSKTDEHFTETFGSKIGVDNICRWNEKLEEWLILKDSEMELMCEEKLLSHFSVNEYIIYL